MSFEFSFDFAFFFSIFPLKFIFEHTYNNTHFETKDGMRIIIITKLIRRYALNCYLRWGMRRNRISINAILFINYGLILSPFNLSSQWIVRILFLALALSSSFTPFPNLFLVLIVIKKNCKHESSSVHLYSHSFSNANDLPPEW